VGRFFLDGPGGIDMATATLSTPVETHSEEYVLLHGVRWSTYEALLEDLEGCSIRLTYDDGSLEIMTVSPRHEWSKSLIRRMIEALTEEFATMNETCWIRSFRAWVRAEVAPLAPEFDEQQ
jgi:hypothetical protein